MQSIDPATGEVIWQGKVATQESVHLAIETARSVFPEWMDTSFNERLFYLQRFTELLKQNRHELEEAISKETGKPLWESKTEVNAVIQKLPISVQAYQSRCAEIHLETQQGHSTTRHRPHGVIAVLGPFNFPAHLPHGHILPALLAGNTIVFKPSEYTPLVAEIYMAFWKQSGIPSGVIHLVQGGKEIGQCLLRHPDIDGLFFTGSWETGSFIHHYFAQHPEKIVALEMGGNNPLVVCDTENVQIAAHHAIQSAFITSGQRCSCARRLILVSSSNSARFLSALITKTKEIVVGSYTDIPEPFMGPVISESAAKKLLDIQTRLKEEGGKILVEIQQLKKGTGLLSPGIVDVTEVKNRKDEEIFGPLLQLVHVSTFEEAIQEANRTRYGLTAGLLSDQERLYRNFYKNARAGIINWNAPTTGASSAAPFGGIGCSGNHRPSAYYAADYCAYPVVSVENPTLHIEKQ